MILFKYNEKNKKRYFIKIFFNQSIKKIFRILKFRLLMVKIFK